MRCPTLRQGAVLFALLFLAGCASRPVLYPNAHFAHVGEARAEADIDHCLAMAEAHGAGSNAVADTATGTAVGAGVGAAGGAAVGAVLGNAGRGAATGAVAGAVGGLLRGLLAANEPDGITKSFVDQCLRDRGYAPIGWK